MFQNSINKKELSEVAKELLDLLVKYQSTNIAARHILEKGKTLLLNALHGEIEQPLLQGFSPEEYRNDELTDFPELEHSIAKFDLLLTGAKSLDDIRKEGQEILKQADKDEKELRDKLK